LTGEPFVNIFGVSTQLNQYDGGYPTDPGQTCATFAPTGHTPLLYESCDMVKKPKFMCEIVLS